MNRTNAARETWHPHTREDRDAILRELEEVLASSHFANSKRYPALLRYIVENTLAGRAELLKERTLGVEVFQRPATYDTNTDTVVRYTAGEVRKRLLLYYSEHETLTGIQISLPAGSYLPEFFRENGKEAELRAISSGDGRQGQAIVEINATAPVDVEPAPMHAPEPVLPPASAKTWLRPAVWLVLAAAIAFGATAGALWATARQATHTPTSVTSVEDFWAPLLHDQRTVMICAGSVVFAQDKYSGVITAGGDADYPFFSMQTTLAITQINGVMERGGATTQLLSAPSTQLTQLREHSVTLVGAYNNQWTFQLMQPLRYHFAPDVVERIIDTQRPQLGWQRDESQPYSSADDYAVVARFRDARIDGWVVALAGIGRNGTEAAAQFATSPHYLDQLRQRLGGGFGNRNIEAVLRVSVIKGETGAPTILEAYTW